MKATTLQTPCINWKFSTKKGYGQWTKLVNGKRPQAHRHLYEQKNGQIPKGMVLDHLCENKACVNTDHLEVVTPQENIRRCERSPSVINAAKTHCPRGHEYTESNIYLYKNLRHCRSCRKFNNKKERVAS